MGIIHRLGIDVDTKDAATLAAKLGNLKATQSAVVAGVYTLLPEIAQVHVHTQMDEAALDAWLCSEPHKCEWHGVFPLPAGSLLSALEKT